jgi:hypothetical protein
MEGHRLKVFENRFAEENILVQERRSNMKVEEITIDISIICVLFT